MKTFQLNGLHCSSCSSRVVTVTKALHGVASSAVDLHSQVLSLEIEEGFSEVDLRSTIEEVGYEFLGAVTENSTPAELGDDKPREPISLTLTL